MKTPDQIADETLSRFGYGVHNPATGITAAMIVSSIKADRAQRGFDETTLPDQHCFREESPTDQCESCGWLAESHTGCDCD